jgi:spermidine synthase
MINAGELHKYIKPIIKGNFEIKYNVATEHEATYLRLRSTISSSDRGYYDFKAGTYVILKDNSKNEIIMSDTPMELRTNNPFIRHAFGDVLLGGLGLGIIILSIQDNPDIKSITVIEKHKEIIEMITSQIKFNDKVIIIHEDIFKYKPKPKTKFDTIYFDIWNNITADNFDDIKKLERRFKRRLNKDNDKYYINSWQKFEVTQAVKETYKYNFGY